MKRLLCFTLIFLSIQIWRSWSFHVKCCVIHHQRYWKSFLAGKYLLLSCIDNRLPSCQATMYFQIFFRQEWNVANDTRGFRVESTIYVYVIYFVGTLLNLFPQKTSIRRGKSLFFTAFSLFSARLCVFPNWHSLHDKPSTSCCSFWSWLYAPFATGDQLTINKNKFSMQKGAAIIAD